MKQDSFEVEFLADGSLKITTDKVSAPNHANAENFLREVAKLCGGKTTIKHKHGVKGHTHTHTNIHQH